MNKKAIPKIAKKVQDFVKDESGVISKKNILKTGILLGAAVTMVNVVGGVHLNQHGNLLTLVTTPDPVTVTAEHSHNVYPDPAAAH